MGKVSNLITSLKSTREARGMTQQELAERIGVRRETILHLENNRYNPSLEMALKIAQVFDLKIEDNNLISSKNTNNKFELLDNKPSRIKVIYFDKKMW